MRRAAKLERFSVLARIDLRVSAPYNWEKVAIAQGEKRHGSTLPDRKIRDACRCYALAPSAGHGRNRVGACEIARRCAWTKCSATRYAVSGGRLDGAPVGAPRSRQPLERVRTSQTRSNRRKTHDQTLRRSRLGRACRFQERAD